MSNATEPHGHLPVPSPRAPIRSRLLRAFLLLLAIPTLSLPLFSLNYLHQHSLSNIRQNSLEKAIQQSRLIDNLLETRAMEVLLVGLFPETRRFFNAAPEERGKALENLRARLEGYFAKHGESIEGIRLLDADGMERLYLGAGHPATLHTENAPDLSDDEVFVGAMHLSAIRGRNLPVHLSHAHPKAPLAYSSLVMNDDGLISGVIVLEVSLRPLLGEIARGGHGQVCRIIDSQGRDLYNDDSCGTLRQISPDALLHEEAGVLEAPSHVAKSLHVYSRIQPSGQSAIRWTVLRSISLDKLDAPFRQVALWIVGITLLTVLLSILLALGFARGISRPLSQLVVAAGDLCRGYWDTMLPKVDRDDEVKALTLAFSSMSRQLRSAHEALVAKIEALGDSEQQLAEEKERLAVTLRSIGDAVLATDLKGTILFQNPAAEKLLGTAPPPYPLTDSLSGEPVQQLTDLLPRPEIPAGDPRELHLAGPGSGLILEATACPIRNPRSETVGAVIVLRDVTRSRALAEEQHRIEKLQSLGVLAGGIAHDFNNLLSVVLGDLSLLDSRLPQEAPDHEIVADASRAAQRARGLTQQLLLFAKGGTPVKRSAALRELVEESARFAMHGSSCALRLESPANLWAVEVDTGQMHQVFHNLSLNAVQAMPEGGVLAIALDNVRLEDREHPPLPAGPYVRVTLRDEGRGIPPHLLNRIFDPYFTTKEQGTGLGLSSAHSIITSHGGTITVSSGTSGTTFTLLLPSLGERSPAPCSPPSPSSPSPTASRPLHILVLDDETGIQITCRRLLEHLGHRVTCVSDGRLAVAAHQRARQEGDPFDLCILDLTIPGGLGGYPTLKQLQQVEPTLRAIVTSGYSQDEILTHPREKGFRAVLQKPFTLQELTACIQKAME